MPKTLLARTSFIALVASLAFAAQALADTQRFDVPAGDLIVALESLAKQANVDLVYQDEQVKGLKTRGVSGDYSPRDAVMKLLEGTPLQLRTDEESGALLITAPSSSSATAAADKRAQLEVGVTIPEILVVGSKILNTDIRRSRDDVQPYTVFERDTIERSSAVNVEDFLRQRLTMNTVAGTNGQLFTNAGNTSQINLRGLGANQTLILVDGRRKASFGLLGQMRQPDLNGIPLAAVERIEVLPTTASGIYGGNATGGVINIVLRRDYSGAEVRATYENSFDADSAIGRIDFGAGFNLEDGKTNVLLTGSYSQQEVLEVNTRDFVQRARTTILTNNPASILNANNPPLGATPNIRSVDGSPLFGPGTPNLTTIPTGYAGGGGIAPLQENAGTYNLDLADTRQLLVGGQQALLNGPRVESLAATVRRQFSPSIDAFLEVGAANNTGYFPFNNQFAPSYTVNATAPNNPFGKAIRVTVPTDAADGVGYSTSDERRAVGGLLFRLPHDWSAGVDYTWNRTRNTFSQPNNLTGGETALIANGTIDVLRDTSAFPLDLTAFQRPPSHVIDPFYATLKDAVVRVAGPIGSWLGETPQLTMLLEHREEELSEARVFTGLGTEQLYPSSSQRVNSAYVETRIPFVSAQRGLRGVRELELQLAGRWDDYTVNGATSFINVGSGAPIVRAKNGESSINPTIGLRYQPTVDLAFRASYGTGFLPPSVDQLAPRPAALANIGVNPPTDPRRGNEPVPTFQQTQGGNPDSQPEESESWSAGVIVTPRFLPGLRASVDYTRIDKTDEIKTLTLQQLFDNENVLPGRIVREPSCPGDPFAPVCRITQVNATATNIARTEVEAYDVALDYHHATMRFGTFDFFAIGTWQTHYQTKLAPSVQLTENVGITNAFPVKLKGNAGLTWQGGDWSVGWTMRYLDSYVVSTNATTVLNQGSRRVPSQTYHDIFASYVFAGDAGGFRSQLIGNTSIQAGIKNVLDEEPPLDLNNFVTFYSPFGDPRQAVYYVSLKRVF